MDDTSYVLGIHLGHDRSVALIKNGILVRFIAQERLDRIKHSRSHKLPKDAIDAVLKSERINMGYIAGIGISEDAVCIEKVISIAKDELKDLYKVGDIQIFPISHHLSHAYSTYFTSGFDESLIIVADGGGDYIGEHLEAESYYIGIEQDIKLIHQRTQNALTSRSFDKSNYIFPYIHKSRYNNEISLARKYEQITYMLGFGWGQAGKTMGLSAYGKSLLNWSNIKIDSLNYKINFIHIIKELYDIQQNSGLTYYKYNHKERYNIAKTIQAYTEEFMVGLVNYLSKEYQIYNLSLTGGLFLNCVMNHKILEKTPIKKIHILPASGDDGQAIGNAIFVNKALFGKYKSSSKELPYLGFSYTNSMIEKEFVRKNIVYEKVSEGEIAKIIAEEISKDKIIAILTGKSEIGPRALCHRSILANPTSKNMKKLLNDRVKHREMFRPFAPVVTKEKQFEIFQLKQDSPYMLLAAKVNVEYRKKLPAITHIDNTARVQSVDNTTNPFITKILIEFEKISGLPVLLNTSFNVAGQPIVESPKDAIETFLMTNIDILVLENYIVYKDCQFML
nr:carbamoyltransferase C-terminal domain-containing protein [uncultured Draconibacterium sp.]